MNYLSLVVVVVVFVAIATISIRWAHRELKKIGDEIDEFNARQH